MTNSLDYRFWQIVDASYTKAEYVSLLSRCLSKRQALAQARRRIRRDLDSEARFCR